jgi:DNA helicase-2/ATP-dependent DNA helicase PcrA
VAIHRNIFVVGDIDQSIYGWRGADYRNVQRYEEDFPEAQVILLEQNYRSVQAILDVAMAVIDRNPYRTPKRLFTERGSGQKINLTEVYDDRAEATYVVDTIAGLVARKQADPGDFAIMYRTNAQSRLLEEAFLRYGLPYKLVGAQRFYGRREVKDVIAYLRLVHNPHDEISLLRAINTPTRGIGNKTVIALRTQAQQSQLTPGELLLELARGDASAQWDAFTCRAAKVVSGFGRLLLDWRALLT